MSASLERLWQTRPRSRFARGSLLAFVVLVSTSWVFGGFDPGDLDTPRRRANLERFLQEIRPYPLQGGEWDSGVALEWAASIVNDRGAVYLLQTLAISIVAIVLAGAGGLLLSLPAARTLASSEAYLPERRHPGTTSRFGWPLVRGSTRLLSIGLRSIPEYILAFLLLATFGTTAWPAILALAIHNAGILGRLGAETIEDLEPTRLAALRALGSSRTAIATWGILPAALPRFLLFFFLRWESCIREATVLGMLGIASLGLGIADARARGQVDTMLLFVLLGSGLVLLGDGASAVARRIVRRA